GAEDNWRPETTTTSANYPSLSHGKYSFKVIAKNSSGTWNSEPVTYDFVIKPPFYQSWWFILGCIILAFFAVFVFIKVRERNLIKEKQILEKKVAERTAEVVEKSEEIEQKNKDITASIRYANRIQKAILPPEDSISETFILFKPKDIVSGDFYWLHISDSKQFIAAVDCTGHGVPGAFMSLIGHNSLNKIVKEYGFTEPAAILDQLNDEVSGTLAQQSESDEVKDGMDLSLIVYDSNTKEVQYAGAYNALYLIRNGELFETKANRFSIGLSSIQVGQKFTNHTIKVKKGDVIYLFSDGYADQFGGIHGKKFKTRNVKELLLSIQHMSMKEQKEHLNKTIEEWKGDLSQIDDILFIGSRITT
ncbi:MAG: SpoIIE family protein phosphatase, partial [Candidatus Cloacimonetes bacterium]|nr:SpoIIE family protein phosphatase [Candidatus Cloacimonadota bacterium]